MVAGDEKFVPKDLELKKTAQQLEIEEKIKAFVNDDSVREL